MLIKKAAFKAAFFINILIYTEKNYFMPNIKRFYDFIAESKSEILQFKKSLEEYYRRRNVEENKYKRAIELIDELEIEAQKDNSISKLLKKWVLIGGTLILMDLLKHTSYKGHLGNLTDFNAFALLDTVGMYNRGTHSFKNNDYMDK